MEKKYSIAEAKNRLPALVHETEKDEPVYLLRRGRPVAVLLSAREYERLQASCRKGFGAALAAFRNTMMHPSEEEITDHDLQGLRDSSLGREPETI
jgi:prevent-host-death family protein